MILRIPSPGHGRARRRQLLGNLRLFDGFFVTRSGSGATHPRSSVYNARSTGACGRANLGADRRDLAGPVCGGARARRGFRRRRPLGRGGGVARPHDGVRTRGGDHGGSRPRRDRGCGGSRRRRRRGRPHRFPVRRPDRLVREPARRAERRLGTPTAAGFHRLLRAIGARGRHGRRRRSRRAQLVR